MIQVGSIGDFEIISKLIPHLLFPGVWESLQADLEIVKGLGGKASSEVEPSEEEFLPLSESSRLSLSDSVSVASRVLPPPTITVNPPSAEKIPKVECLRAPGSPVLPPLSPRLPLSGEDLSPSTETGRDGVFFLEKNIDGLPERNLASPRSHQVSAVRVSVIKPVRQDPDKEPVTAPLPLPLPAPSPDRLELLVPAEPQVGLHQDEEIVVAAVSQSPPQSPPRLTRIPTF